MTSIEPAAWRRAMGGFPTGVTIVTTRIEDRVSGTAVNAFSAVSMSPSLLLICLKHDSRTLAEIRKSGVFGVNILAACQGDLVSRFADKNENNRFLGLAYAVATTGSPLLDGAVAWFDCEVHSLIDGGDHEVVLGRVLAVEADGERAPLLYHRGRLAPFAEGEGGPVSG